MYSRHIVSTAPGDGVYLSGPCDKKDDSQWEMSSKLQQMSEQMKQENDSLKRVLVDGGYIEVTKINGFKQYAYNYY